MAPRPRCRALLPLLRQPYSTRPPSSSGVPLPPLLPPSPPPSSSSSSSSSHLPTTLSGWVRSVRKQKNVSFVVLSDQTRLGGTQVVVPKGLEHGIAVGSSATLDGEWVKSPKPGRPDEFRVSHVSWIGPSDAETYPIPNTKQGIPAPILRHNAHLRPRTDQMAAVLRTRSEMSWAMADHFRNQGFVKIEAPVITSSDCEGGGEVFKVVEATPPPPPAPERTESEPTSSISEPTQTSPSSPRSTRPAPPSRYLTVSSQLHLEAIASSHPRVYALSPCFRAERSDTARHLQEFWMLEAELAFLDPDPTRALEQVMSVCEDVVRAIAHHVQAMPEFDYFVDKASPHVDLANRTRQFVEPRPYARMTYTDAVRLLADHARVCPDAFVYKPEWGSALQTEHEKYLAEDLVRGPVFVTDYPTRLKPFYMLENENEAPRTGDEEGDKSRSSSSTTACFDLLVPDLGELAGGSLRTHSLESLSTRIDRDANLSRKRAEYEWYVDLRRYGTTRHGGFGIGWERLVALLTGVQNVRECIAFPRAGEGSRF
ncbi:hypothetical protein JCM10212_000120 [Sporobolomyces blumeae]